MKIGITGATGFIGRRLCALSRERGHEPVIYTRHPDAPAPQACEVRAFAPGAPPDLSGLDAIVHLAGESLIGLWTPPKKRRIRDSRIEGTRRVVEAINAAANGPRIFVCASAVGYYGDTGETIVTESSPPGAGFLAEVTAAWEAEAARAQGVRTTMLRTGFVIGPGGGAMALIAPVFRLGLGGRLGNGRQWMSCIHLDDVAGLILHAVAHDGVSGPLNAVMPAPVRNAEFTRAVAAAARRPAILPAPSLALKIVLGELSRLLLDSQRVLPARALETGCRFAFPTLDGALRTVFA